MTLLSDDSRPARRGPGRPRHADTEERAYRSALELFGQRGWAGLSLDAVAQHAGVGKSSIYLRWKDKRELLLDAVHDFETRHVNPADPSLPIRDYLVEYAVARAALFLGKQGATMAAIISAAVANPDEYADIQNESLNRGVLALMGRLEQAVAEGEMPIGTSAAQFLEALEGAIVFHTIIAPGRPSKDQIAETLPQYVTELVDWLLRGLPQRRSPDPPAW